MALKHYGFNLLFTLLSLHSYSFKFHKTLSKPEVEKHDTTVIHINLNNSEKASFYFNDQFGDNEPPRFFSKNDKIYKLAPEKPLLLIDSYHQIPFLIYPGEQLLLTVNRDGLPLLTLKNNQVRNNELNFFIAYYYKFNKQKRTGLFSGRNSFNLYTKKIDFDGGVLKTKVDSTIRMSFLRTYKKENKISDAFDNYAFNLFKYLYIVDVFKPITFIGLGFKDLPNNYINILNKLEKELVCDSCILNESYRRACEVVEAFEDKKLQASAGKFLTLYNFMSSSYSAVTKRYLQFILLKKYMTNAPEQYELKFTQFVTAEDDLFSEYLSTKKNTENKFKRDSQSEEEIFDINGQKHSWDELLKKYKGNVVYVDFWASWCIPCRQNFTYSHDLEKFFQGKKIVYLYISIDENAAFWKKALLLDGLNKDNSYLIADKNSTIKKLFNITSIPRYLIVGKNGAILDANSVYPNNRQIKNILQQYLNND